MKNDIDFIWSGREMRRRYIKGEKDMLKDLLEKNRSYRGYDETRKVTEEELRELVAYTRLCPAAANVQPLKYFLAWEPEEVEKVQGLTKWARALPEMVLPHPGKRPTGFVVICQNKRIDENLNRYQKDVGIVAQTMLLAAVEQGLGGCMIGNFQAGEVMEVLGLPEEIRPLLIVAFGKPAEEIHLVDVPEDGNTNYYRDENDVHYVPKRTLADELLN